MKRIVLMLLMSFALVLPVWSQGQQVAKLSGFPSVDVIHPGDTFQIAAVIDIQHGYHMNANKPSKDYLIPTVLTVDAPGGITIKDIKYPAAKKVTLPVDPDPLDVYTERAVILISATAASDLAPGTTHIGGILRYQACSDQACMAPVKVPFSLDVKVAAAGAPAHPVNAEYFSNSVAPVAPSPTATANMVMFSGPSSPEPSASITGNLQDVVTRSGMLLAFIGIFLQGLLLNLTPCVYPLIPITLGFFGAQAQGNARKTFGLSATYVMGLATTYSLLGVAAASTGRLFGSTLQNPWVLVFVSVVFFALSLSMLGVYELTVPSSIASKVESRKGFIGALLMGLFVGIVAAPCVGPFVVSLVTYVGVRGDPVLGFWMFFTLAMGLGFPFLILGFFAGSAKALPRSGAWMVWVKKALGMIMMGLAVYYLHGVMGDTIFRWVMPVFILGAGIYIGFVEKTLLRDRPAFLYVKKGTGLASVAIAATMLVGAARPVAALTWQPYAEPTLQAAVTSKRPIIIDFSATWCTDCQLLEKKTYTDPNVVRESEKFVTMKADLTKSEDPQVQKLTDTYHIKGLPTVIFLGADGKELEDLRLTGFEASQPFLDRMKKAASVPRVIFSSSKI